jgi:hypothetical protein
MVKTALTLPMNVRHLQFEPRNFGRRQPFLADDAACAAPAISDDVKLFATTYAAGFMLVSLFLI